MSANPISWRAEYVVAVTRGSRSRYYYGQTRKAAIAAANLKPGDGFAYAKFERGPVMWSEIGANHNAIVEHGPLKRTTNTKRHAA